ncbi:MAG: TVP38/TMEM64 family protein [Burkholderiales bacterium]|nr:TVP38/TMEM64 family protein [Burkholderiales bacterium]
MPARSLAALAAFTLVAGLAFAATADWLSLEWLKDHRDDLLAYCQRHMLLAVLAYCAAFVAWGALCLPGAGLFALAGGMMFGHLLGTVLATLSATLAAVLAFLIARHLLHDWVHARFARAFRVIDRGVLRDGAFYVFMLRLIIVVPFFVVNPVMGLTDMRVRTFAWASALGLTANAFLWVNAGTMLNRIERLDDILSAPVAASFALVGVLPLILKWLFLRRK